MLIGNNSEAIIGGNKMFFRQLNKHLLLVRGKQQVLSRKLFFAKSRQPEEVDNYPLGETSHTNTKIRIHRNVNFCCFEMHT